jgi:hypothetical protein
LVEFAGLQKTPKRGDLGAKKSLFGLKKGQNRGFAVTDSLTVLKYKLLIPCKLREIKWSKKDFHRVGGWGSGGFRGKNGENGTKNREQGIGLRDGDWTVVITA